MNQIETARLQPADPAQLLGWMEQFSEAVNWLSGVAFRERLWHWLPLQRRAYRELRERFQVPSAAAVVAIRKVAHAYRNKQRRRGLARFRRRGAVPVYKHRYKPDNTVTLYGFRIPFPARPQPRLSSSHRAVLCYRRGKFILHQAVEVDVPALATVHAVGIPVSSVWARWAGRRHRGPEHFGPGRVRCANGRVCEDSDKSLP